MCCGSSGQPGYFEVHAQVGGEDQLLVQGGGTFSYSSVVNFSVPSTTSGDCEDKDILIFVDSDVGEESCDWLGQNMDRYQYLCEFLDVAWACPSTCNACAYFS